MFGRLFPFGRVCLRECFEVVRARCSVCARACCCAWLCGCWCVRVCARVACECVGLLESACVCVECVCVWVRHCLVPWVCGFVIVSVCVGARVQGVVRGRMTAFVSVWVCGCAWLRLWVLCGCVGVCCVSGCSRCGRNLKFWAEKLDPIRGPFSGLVFGSVEFKIQFVSTKGGPKSGPQNGTACLLNRGGRLVGAGPLASRPRRAARLFFFIRKCGRNAGRDAERGSGMSLVGAAMSAAQPGSPELGKPVSSARKHVRARGAKGPSSF